MSTYAVSDLHGQYETFMQGLKEIKFTSNDRLYVIGDAIDRGPDGIKLLQEIMINDNMDLILGNHEFLMLNSVDREGGPFCRGMDTDLWLDYNGGDVTFEEYGYLEKKERSELLSWLMSRELIKTVSVDTVHGKLTFTLCHSFYDPKYDGVEYKKISYWDAWDIVWRSLFRDDPDTKCGDVYKDYPDRIFITGHVPVQRLNMRFFLLGDPPEEYTYRHGNLLNIDGGLAFGDSGAGSAAVFFMLEEGKEFVVPLKKS